MRNRALHDALREFALEAAALLSDDQRSGGELKFDVLEERRRGGPTLYRYVPLVEDYIGERWERLRSLPTCAPAGSALGAGAAQYLSLNGLRGAEAEPALRAMLERIYEDATGFGFPEERFEAVYAEVERTLFEDTTRTAIVAPMPGVVLEARRVELGDGLALVRGDAYDDPPSAAVWPDEDAEPLVLCELERDTAPGDAPLAPEARERFRRLLTGLRLFKPGGVSLGSMGWARPTGGRWQPVGLEGGGAARGEPWILVEGEDAELCEFLQAIGRSTHGGAVAFALARFEMGCGRTLDAEALSDYLLALRALLDAYSEAGRASLALRLAALCAEDDERRMVQRRVELALALERFVMAGGREDAYVETIGSESPRTLVSEMERHLRALLRDVMCGFLDPDLKGVADDILLKAPDHLEIRARDLRHEESDTTAIGREESDTAEIEALAEPEPEEPVDETPEREPDEEPWEVPEPDEEPEQEPDDVPAPEEPEFEPVGSPLEGVTPSDDWDDYSAPV
jgi:hypothetical protein